MSGHTRWPPKRALIVRPPWAYGVHPEARWRGEPARGRWARRVKERLEDRHFFRAGFIFGCTWEVSLRLPDVAATCRRSKDWTKPVRGVALYRHNGVWSFAALTSGTVFRWGGESPYGEGPSDAGLMVMRP